ncbi:MAG TPA: type II toxin-antitoxin system PemK/MazF family toxin [Pirellulales bacterium]|nr:type II toxin-antitoxin system PemK/MazF family toxin [Pirellulales bacterium]
MPDAGDVVVADFPGVMGVKRRPAVVVSSLAYHSARPDVILGLITSKTAGASAATDYVLQDWSAAGLRLPSAFRAFLVTLPRSSVSAKIGTLSTRDLDQVRRCLKAALLDLPATVSGSP